MDQQQLYSGNNFRIYKYHEKRYFNRRMGSPRHYINYIVKGHARYITPQGVFEFGAGDFFYIPMGLPYDIYAWGSPEHEMLSCGFNLFPEARTKKFKVQHLPKEHVAEFLMIPLDRLPDTPTLVKFYTLLQKLLPHLQETSETPPLLEMLSRLILENPTYRIPALARHCGLAEPTLYVHVKKLTGKTPNEYRMGVLMAEALRLVASTDIPINEIAEQLGFSTVNYFRRQFKLYTSAVPTAYRKQKIHR